MGRNKDPECPGFVSEHEKAELNGIGILVVSSGAGGAVSI